MRVTSEQISAAAALVLGLAGFVALAPSAGAITLMDMLRGGPGTVAPDSEVRIQRPDEPVAADPEPLPRISGPRYYAYRADALRAVDPSGFAAAFKDAKVKATPEIAAALESYYRAGGEPLFVQDGEPNDRAAAVLAFLATVGDQGLDPADYSIAPPARDVTASIAAPQPQQQSQPQRMAAAHDVGDAYRRALMQFELSLSAKVLAYVQDTGRGRVDPNRLSGYHDFKRKAVDLDPVLKLLRLSPDVAAYLGGRQPSNPQYLTLQAELRTLLGQEGSATANAVAFSADLVLKPGESSAEMAGVVTALERRASAALKAAHAVTLAAYDKTPQYAPDLVDLVKAFQSEAGLKADGVIGRATLRALTGDDSRVSIAKLEVALEQIRWLPDDLGSRYVFINQPAFMAYYYEGGMEQFGMRTVVGSKANQTYFFEDEIETVEFNPYWGVPQSIIVNEMLPKLRRDPAYLDRLGYEVQLDGRAVSSSGVNWFGSVAAVSVRQPPSSDNALGELKILFPNAHAIYMHDTPAKSYFSRDMRALSHGCIRLAEPRRMAAAVLGTTVDSVKAQIATGKHRAVPLPRKVAVYVSYFTAWPDKNGKVQYFDDVYDRDSHVLKAFSVTSRMRNFSI